MPTNTFNTTFNINHTASLNQGEKLFLKLYVTQSTTNDFTASISQGGMNISSLSVSTGYATTTYSYFHSASISTGSNSNEIIFSTGISSFYDNGYIFSPNPLSGSASSSLYPVYGDVDYEFKINPFDIVIIHLSDGTYIESRILNAYKGDGNLLRLTLDSILSDFTKSNLINGTYQKFLLLTRKDDETNAYLTFQKRPGSTSYGFIIPNDLSADVLNNIDTITKEVKQKLLADQQGVI